MTSVSLEPQRYKGFSDGNEAALKEIFQEHSPLILGLSRKLVGEDAEDLLQTVFLSAWKNRKQYDPVRGSMKSWLCGITRFRAIDLLRKNSSNQSTSIKDTDVFADADSLADQDVDKIVDALVIKEALKELPSNKKRLLEMGFIQQLSHKEIAEITSMPLGTVKSTIRRGLELLEIELEGSLD